MSQVQTIRLNYQPRDVFVAYHARKQRYALLVCHRRAGKTVAAVMDLVDHAIRCAKERGRYAYIAPFFKQAKQVAWDYLQHYARQIPGTAINQAELRVDFPNGARISLYGSDNPDALRGIYLDGVVFDETQDHDPRVWPEIVRPTLADRKGWATFLGTPRGKGPFWQLKEHARCTPAWYHAVHKASETGYIDEEELVAAQQSMTKEQYAQEFECSFESALVGAYYADELAACLEEGRIKKLSPIPGIPVYTAWDLGIGDSTAIVFFQVTPQKGVNILDHYENSGKPLAHYVEEIKKREYDWGKRLRTYLPQDARVRSLDTGRTRVETLQQLGCEVYLVSPHKVEDGINAVRVGFKRFAFHEDACSELIEMLKQYRREWDDVNRVWKDKPLHDWTSHSADAVRYMAMAWRELTRQERPRDVIKELTRPRTAAELFGTPETWELEDA